MSNFDDFLARESLEREEVNDSDRNGSTFNDSIPVYRSIEHMPADTIHTVSHGGIDKVFECAMVQSDSIMKGTKQSPHSVGEPTDDLFSFLQTDLKNTSLPRKCDLLGGVSLTSVPTETPLSALITSILTFLRERGIHHEHIEESSLWKCEMTDFTNSCKFQIQVYSDVDKKASNKVSEVIEGEGGAKYTVEFLRIAGSSLLFSSEFQRFKQEQSPCVENNALEPELSHTPPHSSCDVPPLDMEQSQQALEAFVAWAAADPAGAASAVCGMFSHQPSTISSATVKEGTLSAEGILVMTLLGSMCVQFKETVEHVRQQQMQSQPASLPLLSLLHLLLLTRNEHPSSSTLHKVLSTLINALLPAARKLAQSPSSCEQHTAAQLLEMVP